VNNAVHIDRFVPLEGSINFRDFGGYRTVEGRNVKWGTLFRCGSLGMLQESVYDDFARLGISVICDLRREDEAANSPSPGAPPFDCRHHIPIAPGSTVMLRESLQDSSQTAADRVRFMTEITRELAMNHHAEYRALFERLLSAENGFLLHCSAGKDRTGFGAALILSALGVDESTVMQDYLLTNQATCLRNYMNTRLRDFYGPDVDEESLEVVTGVRAEYLEAALHEVRRLHGSLEAYLDEIGVDAPAKQELRQRLLA